jgi:flagella synthesis protein FlgN
MTNAVELIEQQIKQLDVLHQILIDELEAFKQRQPDVILSIAELKVECLSRVNEIDQTLAQLDDLTTIKQQPEIKALLNTCDEKLAFVKQQSAVNEHVIKTSLNNITQLKQSLLALKNADAMTYDKLGKAQTQTLGKGIKA